MRTIGGGNSAQPTSGFGPNAITAVKVEVANASDALVDLSTYVKSLDYEQTTDEIVNAATVVFKNEEGASSLAPLMTASPPVAVGRRIVVSINPGSGTYKEIFRGKIDEVDWPERFGDVKVQCRDQAGTAADTWVENKIAYSTTAGVSLETVMQEVVDDNLTTSYTLNFPAATSAVVQHVEGDLPYGPENQSVLDALRALAESIGWTVRWRHFDASASDWKWTVFQPSRTKTTPDHTFGTSDYWDVTQMGQSIEDIRNVVEVEYTATGGARARVIVQDSVSTGCAMTALSTTLTRTGGNTFAATDVGKTIKVPGAGAAGATLTTTIATRVSATEVTLATAASTTVSGKTVEWGSIADYGRRYMKISEASDSPVNTSALATSLANAALSDLKDPDALMEIECRYFWPGEVGVDLYRFTANNKHFSSNQDLAAVSFRHRIAVGESPTTWILTRGKPSGGVLMWKRHNQNAIAASTPSAPDINVSNFREVERSQTAVTLGWNVSGDIDEIWVWYSTPAQPLASDPWASFTGIPTARLTRASTSYAIAIPGYGAVTYVQIVPIGVRENVVVRGNPARFTVQGEQVRLVQRVTRVSESATQMVFRVAVARPIAGGDVTIAYSTGMTVSPASGQTIAAASVTSSLDTTGTVDFTVTRPSGSGGGIPGTLTFTATSTDSISDVDTVTVPATDLPTTGLVGTIETAQIADAAITAAKIGAAAVETAKLANLAVTSAILAANAVTTTKITDDAITTAKIAAGQITAAKIAAGTITSNEIAANTITAGDIAAGTITATEIAASTITGGKIAALTIEAGNIAANTITAGKLSVTTLSSITADIGDCTAGKVRNAGDTAGVLLSGSLPGTWTRYLDFTATGSSAFLKHDLFQLNADGTVASLRYRCSLRNSASQNVGFTSSVDLTWNTEDADVGGLHSTASNTERITIPSGGNVGFWIFNFAGVFNSSTSQGAIQVFLAHYNSGGTLIANICQDQAAYHAVGGYFVKMHRLVSAPAVGDYYKVTCAFPGSPDSAFATAEALTFFEAVHVF